jgi:hypothetical protein
MPYYYILRITGMEKKIVAQGKYIPIVRVDNAF